MMSCLLAPANQGLSSLKPQAKLNHFLLSAPRDGYSAPGAGRASRGPGHSWPGGDRCLRYFSSVAISLRTWAAPSQPPKSLQPRALASLFWVWWEATSCTSVAFWVADLLTVTRKGSSKNHSSLRPQQAGPKDPTSTPGALVEVDTGHCPGAGNGSEPQPLCPRTPGGPEKGCPWGRRQQPGRLCALFAHSVPLRRPPSQAFLAQGLGPGAEESCGEPKFLHSRSVGSRQTFVQCSV